MVPHDVAPRRLVAHLSSWLGAWPPHSEGVTVVGHAGRLVPGWDGLVHRYIAVATPTGAVLSVPPEEAHAISELTGRGSLAEDLLSLGHSLSTVIDADATIMRGPFRWSLDPTPTKDVGEWVSTDDERVPEWLLPFNGDVLIEWDDHGRYGAGVGRKMHDDHGHELSVGTEESLRGRGIARLLVATGARRVIDDGAVPTYLHAPDNFASAKVAEASGFPDRGWTFLGVLVRERLTTD